MVDNHEFIDINLNVEYAKFSNKISFSLFYLSCFLLVLVLFIESIFSSINIYEEKYRPLCIKIMNENSSNQLKNYIKAAAVVRAITFFSWFPTLLYHQ